MIEIVPVTMRNVKAFREVRLRALKEDPSAFGSTYAREAAFADDTWRVSPKLTLSLGLRYELTPPWTDTLNNLFTVAVPHINAVSNAPDTPYLLRQGNCTDPYAGIRIQWPQIKTTCSNGVLSDRLMRTDYKDFAPRFGVGAAPSVWI